MPTSVSSNPDFNTAQQYIDVVNQVIQSPSHAVTKIESMPVKTIDQLPVQNDDNIISVPQTDVQAPIITKEEPIVITKETNNPVTNTESRNPIYNTLSDYVVSYMDSKSYPLGDTPEELQKNIAKYTKEAILANPSILRYGMVIGASVPGDKTYIGTIIEDPSTKFTKKYLKEHDNPGIKVNTIMANGKVSPTFFPLENITEVIVDQKPVL